VRLGRAGHLVASRRLGLALLALVLPWRLARLLAQSALPWRLVLLALVLPWRLARLLA
jgi:hypothetical protein